MEKKIKLTVSILIVAVIFFSSFMNIFAAQTIKPNIDASGAIVYCENTGEIVYSKNKDDKMDPLSVTKLMTALLAVQNLPLDKEITVSKEAAAQGESTMGLKEGEILTVRDLLYGALLKSGNDAAYALGEAVSGDMESFVKLMNKTAMNIGCDNTHFVNANGLKQSKHYTTAYDMMQIVKVAFTNDIVKNIAGTSKYTVKKTNKSKARNLKSHVSFVLDKDSGVYAGKTGYWDESNASIALGYKKNGLNLYIVLLGDTGESRTADVNTLIKYATEKVEGIKVVSKGEAQGKVRIKHGEKTRTEAYTAEIGYAYLPKEASKALIGTKVVMNEDVKAPLKAGDVVGIFQIYVGDELVNEINLVSNENIDIGWFPSYLGISNMMTIVIASAVIFVLIFMLIIVILRAKHRREKKRRRQQKIMDIAIAQLKKEEEQKKRGWTF